jgi:hypothetical protein
MKLLQNWRSGFLAENRILQFAGERRSADRRYVERKLFRGFSM